MTPASGPPVGSTASTASPAAASRATSVTFAGLGVAIASWAARIPQVKAHLGLANSQLGLVLLCLAAGSMVALPAAGPLVVRLGSRRTLRGSVTLAGVGLAVVALGSRDQVAIVVVGLALLGIAAGVWDVAVNVEGAIVERLADRPLMPRFHACYSVGAVAGALLGAGMIAAHVSVTADLLGVAVVVVASGWPAAGWFVADGATHGVAGAPAARRRNPWRERRTLLIGLMVLAFALAEGTGSDWIGVSMIQGRHAAPAVGTLAYGTFLLALTGVRWFGSGLLARLGRVAALRLLTGVAVAGLLLFTLSPWTGGSFLGVALWGGGIALGFPVGMSAGADDPVLAAPRVGTITSIGYVAFLGGPPLIGLLATGLELPHALWVVIVVLLPAAVITSAARPLAAGPTATGRDPDRPTA